MLVLGVFFATFFLKKKKEKKNLFLYDLPRGLGRRALELYFSGDNSLSEQSYSGVFAVV